MQTWPGLALGAYRPLFVRVNGERIRNPEFDNHSQQILNLKEPGKGWFAGAVAYCSKLVIAHAASLSGFDRAQVIVMPSSQQGKVSAGLERVARNLANADRRFVFTPGSLVRSKTIEKLARGGDRSLSVHLASLQYHSKDRDPVVKFVLDDVCTTSNSLGGAITVIRQSSWGPVDARALVLGKTTHG